MTWYYALGNDRQGPVEDAELDRLIASGVVTSDTLVWRAGMADWQPLSQARPRVAPPPDPVTPASDVTRMIPAAGTPASRATDPATQPRGVPTPTFGTPGMGAGAGAGAPGASTFGATPLESPDVLYARATSRTLEIGQLISRGWQLVMDNMAVAVGVSALCIIAIAVAGAIPCIGFFVSLVVRPTILGGLYLMFLKLLRGEPAGLNEAFSGFSIAFLPLVLQGIVTLVITLLAMLPGMLVIFMGAAIGERSEGAGVALMGLGGLLAFIPSAYLGVSWVFSLALIIDKRMDFWPAMELSRKVVQQHFLTVFGLLLLCVLIVFAGVLALCLGVFVAAPVAFAATAIAYEELFAEVPAR
jgi:uncharacterized protein DUF4339